MKTTKKKKKFPVVLVSVLATVLFLGIFITVRINNYLKGGRQQKVQTAVQEPDINAEERRRGFNTSKGDLIGIFEKRVKEDSLSMSEDTLGVMEPIEVVPEGMAEKTKAEQKKVEKAPVTALSSTIEETTAKPAPAAAPRPTPKPQPKKEVEYRDVSFNFHIVKDESSLNVLPSEPTKNKALDESIVLTEAKIYGQHTLKHMESVTLRSTERIQLNNREFLPEGTLLYGVCRVTSNRMEITVTRAMTRNGNFPVELEVYDNDFQKGIFIRGHDIDLEPENNMDDITNEIGQAAFGSGNQLAGAVTRSAARSAQRDIRKMKRASLIVPDGYVVYIFSNNNQNRTRR